MRRLGIILCFLAAAIVGLLILKTSPSTSNILWQWSRQGTWLLPLVIFSSLLDSIHPCSFSVLLLTIAFLFGMQMDRRRILAIGGTYVAGIFLSYFLIGLGILKVFHFFNTPHFMGKLGALMLIAFGVINVLNEFFPSFPIKLKLPRATHESMSRLIDQASVFAALGLGMLVGICQFPCMGGPYLMVIGLLHDQVTYFRGFGYLLLYNAVLVVPLVSILFIAADTVLVKKMQEWQKEERSIIRWVGGLIMIILGLLIYLL